MVVMGSQGRGFIGEVFLGSVSHTVTRHSKVPLLLIPAIRQTIRRMLIEVPVMIGLVNVALKLKEKSG